MKLGRVTTVISLGDEDRTSLKAFDTSCLENDLKDFGLGEEWFIKPLVNVRAPKTQAEAIITEIMQC